MRSWCREFGERQGIQVEFKNPEAKISLPPEIGHCLFRVLQEALHNAAKYSGVRRMEVQLREDEGEIHLLVSDSGRGFDLETATQGRGSRSTHLRTLPACGRVSASCYGNVLLCLNLESV